MQEVIRNIRQELKKNIDPKHREGERRYFKGEIQNYGVKAALVRRLAKKYFKEVQQLPKPQLFALCEELLKSGEQEEITIALQWAFNIKKQYQKGDFALFERWLGEYVTNWAKCDDFCTHAFGYFILQFPEFIGRVKQWAKSDNRWLRRAAAVIFIFPIKKKMYNDEIFAIVDMLLLDKDTLVQKGYGWLLKEISKFYPQRVFDYVFKHKNYMPRVALRCAIEKLPKEMKRQAMAK